MDSLEIIARQLTVDMYNCKTNRFTDMELLKSTLLEMLETSDFNVLKIDTEMMDADHYAMLLLLKEGHLTIHTYASLRYAAADIFLCEKEAEPEKLFKALRGFFKPDKTKTTYLKRGDFGTVKDMKPKIKTRVAPLRRIHNTGAKVIRLLAHRNRKSNY